MKKWYFFGFGKFLLSLILFEDMQTSTICKSVLKVKNSGEKFQRPIYSVLSKNSSFVARYETAVGVVFGKNAQFGSEIKNLQS